MIMSQIKPTLTNDISIIESALNIAVTDYTQSSLTKRGVIMVGRQVIPYVSELPQNKISATNFDSDVIHRILQSLSLVLIRILTPIYVDSTVCATTINGSTSSVDLKSILLDRTRSVVAGALSKHAASEMIKASTNFDSTEDHNQPEPGQVVQSTTEPQTSAEAKRVLSRAQLQMPMIFTFPQKGNEVATCSSIFPLHIRIMCTSLIEYLSAELLELAGASAHEAGSIIMREGEIRVTMKHLIQAVDRDPELKQTFRTTDPNITDWFLVTGDPKSSPPELMYPLTQALLRRFYQQYAWYHQPQQIEKILSRFKNGEIKSGGSRLETTLGLVPIAWYGRSVKPVFCSDEWWSEDDLDIDPHVPITNRQQQNFPDWRFYNSAGFDLIDGGGREYHLLIEWRPLGNDRRTRHGAVFDRISSLQLASFNGDGSLEWEPEYEVSMEEKVKIAQFFAHYTPRNFQHQKPNLLQTELEQLRFGRKNQIQELSPELATIWSRARHDAFSTSGVQNSMNPHLSDDKSDLSLVHAIALEIGSLLMVSTSFTIIPVGGAPLVACQLYHPVAVLERFNTLPIREALDSTTVERKDIPDVLVQLTTQFVNNPLPAQEEFEPKSIIASMNDSSSSSSITRFMDEKNQPYNLDLFVEDAFDPGQEAEIIQ